MSTPKVRKPDPWRKGQWRPADDRRSGMQQVIDKLDLIADRLKAVAEVLPPPSTSPVRSPTAGPPDRRPNAAGVVATSLTPAELAATAPAPETVRRMKLAAEQAEQREIERQEAEHRKQRPFATEHYDAASGRMTFAPRMTEYQRNRLEDEQRKRDGQPPLDPNRHLPRVFGKQSGVAADIKSRIKPRTPGNGGWL
jgi:hypothetical protein